MKMKAYILYLGDMYSDSTYSVLADTYANAANPDAPHRMGHTPSSAILIEHPEAGWIIYDTGMPDYPQGVWTNSIIDAVIIEKPEGTRMVEQLALVGVKPEDIKYVINSHMHMDHTGNDHLFAETAEFFVSKEDAAQAYRMVLGSSNREEHGWYIKDEVLLNRKKVTYIDRDTELFPGVEVVLLPGHTPAVMGLVLHLEGGTIIFTSDASNEQRNFDGMLPGGPYDSLGYVESIRKLKDLQKKHNAKVVFSHDSDQFAQIKKAPGFFE